ncbi:hypothetical protein ACIO7M_12270 [Streptomyces toxytricini]|uniref:Uncharacterized protein n=1 Tax=Streptomyces toxytricini TaxID=67369 RepID=A0ABW8EF57_STRT5
MILLCCVGQLPGTAEERLETLVSSLPWLRPPGDRQPSYSGHPGGITMTSSLRLEAVAAERSAAVDEPAVPQSAPRARLTALLRPSDG